MQQKLSQTSNLNCFLSLTRFNSQQPFAIIVLYPGGIWIERKRFSSQTSLAKLYSNRLAAIARISKEGHYAWLSLFWISCDSLSAMEVLNVGFIRSDFRIYWLVVKAVYLED
jgi:hypothetical protein